jgi:RHS repeat-associated protein
MRVSRLGVLIGLVAMLVSGFPLVESVFRAAPAGASLTQTDPGVWCGTSGQTARYVSLPEEKLLASGSLASSTWATARVTGTTAQGGPGLGVPVGASAVVLRLSATSTSSGYATVAPTTAVTVASAVFDAKDTGEQFTVTSAVNSQGNVSWFFATNGTTPPPVTYSLRVVGYHQGGQSGDGFVPVTSRRLVDTTSGQGLVAPGAVSDLTVNATSFDSGVPVDASVVHATIQTSMPAGSTLSVGADPVQLTAVSQVPPSATSPVSRSVSTLIPVRDGRFAIGARDALGAPVSVHMRVSVEGWYGASSSVYQPSGTNGAGLRVVSSAAITERKPLPVQITGNLGLPTSGISGVLVAVHLMPADTAADAPGGLLNVSPAGPVSTRTALGSWSTEDKGWETAVAPVDVGADGKIQVEWKATDTWARNLGYAMKVTVEVLGVFCDRELPTTPVVSSTTHPAGSWSTQPTVKAAWPQSVTAAGSSGLAGYAVAVNDDAAFVPPAQVTHDQPGVETKAIPGRSWLHVRAISKSGAGGKTAHYALQSQSECSSLGTSSYVPLPAALPIASGYYTRNEGSVFTARGLGGIPQDAVAVRINVSARPGPDHVGQGAVYVHPGDDPTSGGAPLGYSTGPMASSVTVRLGTYDGVAGRFLLRVVGHAVIDASISGYYTDSDGLGYTAKALRALDTRSTTGRVHAAVIDPSVAFGGGAGIPGDGVSAVVASISVIRARNLRATNAEYNPDIAGWPYYSPYRGTVAAGPAGAEVDLAQVLDTNHYSGHDVRMAQGTIPLDALGNFRVVMRAANGAELDENGIAPTADLVVDIHGYYSAKGSEFHPVDEGSRRILNGVSLGANSVAPVPVAGIAGIPKTGVVAVEGALHAKPVEANGWHLLRVSGMGEPQANGVTAAFWNDPSTAAPEWQSHGVTAPIGAGANGAYGFEVKSDASTQTVYFDAAGYFCRPVPKITSSTHPDPTSSYPQGANFTASWTIKDDPAVIAGYQVAFTTSPTHTFASTTSPARQTATTFTASAPAQGTRWLHVRAVGTTGVPSETASYRVDIAPGVSGRDLAFGYEPWWSHVDRRVGPAGTASVNVATGNLVVQHDDIPPVQAAGDLAFNLRRTYNSHDTATVMSSLFGFDIGAGWTLNTTDLGDATGIGGVAGIGLAGVPTNPTNLAPASMAGLVMVDRDGTRHTFTHKAVDVTAGPLALSTTGLPGLRAALDGAVNDPLRVASLANLDAFLADPVVAADVASRNLGSNLALCIDSRYAPPPGVHVALWRYVLVGASAPLSNTACTNLATNPPGPAVAIGYSTIRPDRVSQAFTFDGRVLSLRDSAGNALAYAYNNSGRLTTVYEPGVNACTPTAPGCRTLKFTVLNDSGGTVVATDPAGRHVAYRKVNGRLHSVTAYDAQISAANVGSATAPAHVLEEWQYTYDGAGAECGPSGLLCEIHSPRALAETLAPFEVNFNADSRVEELTELGGGPATTFEYTAAHTNVARGGQATRYAGIDAHGRVHEISDAAPADLDTAPLRRTRFEWDATGASCELPGGTARANNLCATVRVDVDGNSGGNRRTSMDYNAEGRVVRTTAHGDTGTGGDAITTNAYRTINYQPNGSYSISEDAINGSGTVIAATRPDRLFAITDATAALTPRGNATGAAWTRHLTRWSTDNSAAKKIGTVGAAGACGTGNSGLTCTTRSPEAQVTTNTYNPRGQLASTLTPTAAHADNAKTTYHYAPDTNGTQTASDAGWLAAVEDADTNRVTFAHDTASNVTAVWDRNAWNPTLGEPATRPDDGTHITFDSGANGQGPWRWDNSTMLPVTPDDLSGHGAKTTTARDRHGNPITVTTPRGNATTTVFDGRDRPTSTTNAAGDTTTTRYDANGNTTRVKEHNGRLTATRYDGAGRATKVIRTRSAGSTNVDLGCRAATADDITLLDTSGSPVVCETATEYTSYDETRSVTEPSGAAPLVTTNQFDRFGRQIGSSWDSAAGQVVAAAAYDLDGNQTVDCAQGWAEQQACAAYAADGAVLDAGVTVTSYDHAGRATQSRYDRVAVDAAGNTVGIDRATIRTTTTYDTAGQVIARTDPAGNQTTIAYNRLGRQIKETTPRDGTVSHSTRWIYDRSGNTTAVLAPADADTLGAITYDNDWVTVTGYEWDKTNRAVAATQAAQAVDNFHALAPQASTNPGDPVVNARTEYAYDPDGNRIAILAPRAFQDSGSLADPDERWLTRTDHDARGYPVRTWTTQESSTAAENCPTPSPATPAQASRFSYSGQTLCATTAEVDDAGNPTEVATPGGKTFTYDYNHDRLVTGTSAPAPDGASSVTTTSRYDGAGRVRYHDTPAAKIGERWITETTYSPDGLPVQTIGTGSDTSSTTAHVYDRAGRVTKTTQTGTPDRVTESAFYSDGLTRSFATGALTTTYKYDVNGNATDVVQPENTDGTHLVHTFTADNLLQSTTETVYPKPTTTGEPPWTKRITAFGYNPSGAKTSEKVTTATFESNGTPTGEALGRHAGYRYQATGWLAAELNVASTSERISYGHNLDGTLKEAVDATGPVNVSMNFAWDTRGNATQQQTKIGSTLYSTVDAKHQPDGEVDTTTVAHDGETSITNRDYAPGAATPTSAEATLPGASPNRTATYEWTDSGHLAEIELDSAVETRGYRSDGAIKTVATPDGRSHGYTHDAMGRVKTHTPAGFGVNPAQTYTYDDPGRVRADGMNSYDYDDNNNRELVDGPDTDVDTTYRRDNTMATQTTTTANGQLAGDFPYDAAGRRNHPFLVNQVGTDASSDLDQCVYEYDFLNRTTGIDSSVTDGCDQPTAGGEDLYTAYLHDPLGRQIAQLTASSDTVDLDTVLAAGWTATDGFGLSSGSEDLRVYGLDDQLARTTTTDRDGDTVDTTAYELDGRILDHRATGTGTTSHGTQVLNTDGRGNITHITTTTGTTLCARFYDPFGNQHADMTASTGDPVAAACEDDETTNRLWYRGGQQDAVDGTYHYGSRHYDPATGTWTTPDTARPGAPLTDLSIGTDPLTQNRYTYVNGDPINHADPSGHIILECTTGEMVCRSRAGGPPVPMYRRDPLWEAGTPGAEDEEAYIRALLVEGSELGMPDLSDDQLARAIAEIGFEGLTGTRSPDPDHPGALSGNNPRSDDAVFTANLFAEIVKRACRTGDAGVCAEALRLREQAKSNAGQQAVMEDSLPDSYNCGYGKVYRSAGTGIGCVFVDPALRRSDIGHVAEACSGTPIIGRWCRGVVDAIDEDSEVGSGLYGLLYYAAGKSSVGGVCVIGLLVFTGGVGTPGALGCGAVGSFAGGIAEKHAP